MPHFLEDADPEEIRAIVAYLWTSSRKVDYASPPAGDSDRGEELFNSVGCTGCHIRDAAAVRHDFVEPYRLHGPNLVHLGSKVNAAWLFAWIDNPKQYSPDTPMPSHRLSDQEVADLTAYLMASRAHGQDGEEFPPAGEAELEAGREAIELYGCYGCHAIAGFEETGKHASELDSAAGFSGHGISGLPDFGLSERELELVGAAVDGGSAEGDAVLAEGRRLITRYNCRGCHMIEDRGQAVRATIDDAGMLPPNLRSEGSRVQPEWLSGYLADPGSARQRPWLRVEMPDFGFSGEEIRTIVDYFSAMEDNQPASLPADPAAARSIAVGRETFDVLDCGRCHPAGEEAVEASNVAAGDLAPSLEVASRRLRHDWIPLFIKDPQHWLPGTRMPSFFFESTPGVFDTPFPDGLDAPMFAESRARLMEHFDSDEELESYLQDADALIDAMTAYIWSLGGADPLRPR
jgi:cytochrome c2